MQRIRVVNRREKSAQFDSLLALSQINYVSLEVLNEVADAFGVAPGVSVAGERIGPAARFNENVRPNQPGFDVDGRDFGNADADFILAKPGTFAADDGKLRDFNDGGKEEVATRPMTGFKNFRRHNVESSTEYRPSAPEFQASPV